MIGIFTAICFELFHSLVEIAELLNIKKKNYLLPKILQMLEAYLVIDKISHNLIANSALSFLTIHDSFLYQLQDKELVNETLEMTI